ncbi:hypothetical protein M405DRAFT_870511 [Rhizopogon salebrosus TDB-379]|nr:hypothetical protein M405DRAFT_870511 [Rhizopogon salebrosus TDB-379]
MGVYQDGIAKNIVNSKPVAAHIYKYTMQVKIEGTEKGVVVVQSQKSLVLQRLRSKLAAQCVRSARHCYNAQPHLNLSSFNINSDVGLTHTGGLSNSCLTSSMALTTNLRASRR